MGPQKEDIMQETQAPDQSLLREFFHGTEYTVKQAMNNRLRALQEQGHTLVRRVEKIGRNDPCPCGSGKKFKKCCIAEVR